MAATKSFSLEALKEYRALHGSRSLRAYIERNLVPLVEYLSREHHEHEDKVCAILAEALDRDFSTLHGQYLEKVWEQPSRHPPRSYSLIG